MAGLLFLLLLWLLWFLLLDAVVNVNSLPTLWPQAVITTGLGLYSLGALLFAPAAFGSSYRLFLGALLGECPV